MTDSYSKALPSSFNGFLPSVHEAHRDLNSHNQASSSSFAASFRTARRGTDDDWGRFSDVDHSLATSMSTFAAPPEESTFSSTIAGSFRSEGLYERDGDAVRMLLKGDLSEAVHGNWENDLMEERAGLGRWKDEFERAVPVDPPSQSGHHLASSSLSKGKERMIDQPTGSLASEEELLSSLSSLSLLDKSYLQSLLAQPSSDAVSSYLAQGSYTDDVYGFPAGVKKLLDQATKGTEMEGEEGKKKAVRRLAMVMNHLWGARMSTTDEPTSASTMINARSVLSPTSQALQPSTFVPSPAIRSTSPAPSSRPPSWTLEYPLASQHSRSTSRFQPQQHQTDLELGRYERGETRGRTDGEASSFRQVEEGNMREKYETYLRERSMNRGGSSI